MPLAFVRPRLLVAGLGFAASAIGISACSLGGDTALPPYTDPATQVYDTSTKVVIANMTRVNAQLFTSDVTVGTGRTVTYGDSVKAYYAGRLVGGYKFDSRARPDSGIVVKLDTTSNIIRGWSLGLPGMKVGGVRRLVIGPENGYGYTTRTNDAGTIILIPSNSVLVFDVEVTAATPKP
jgi:FKBP-type peptidyl-prolyl cis-trans isomerase FkpA